MTGHIVSLVGPLIDGQLDHDVRDRALAHLAICCGCQTEVASQRAVKARLAALGGPSMPAHLSERLVRIGSTAAPGCASAPQRRSPAVGERVARGLPPAALALHADRPGPAPLGALRHPAVMRLAMYSGPAGSPVPVGPPGSPGRSGRGPAWQAAVAPPRRRTRVRTTLVGSAAVMLIAVAGSAAVSDGRGGGSPAQPVTAPTAASAGTKTVPGTSQRSAPSLATLSVSVARGR